MSNDDIEKIYKQNVAESHFAGLRGVFDAGFALGAGTGVPTVDQSSNASATTASADTPVITTP